MGPQCQAYGQVPPVSHGSTHESPAESGCHKTALFLCYMQINLAKESRGHVAECSVEKRCLPFLVLGIGRAGSLNTGGSWQKKQLGYMIEFC